MEIFEPNGPSELVDRREAAVVLQVVVAQIDVMIEQGLIDSTESSDQPMFLRADLLAVRLLGG